MADPAGKITLRGALSQSKWLVTTTAPLRSNTSGKAWPEVSASMWEDFTLDNLNAQYAQVLDYEFSTVELHALLSYPPSSDLVQITQAADINRLIKRNRHLLANTLTLAQGFLGLHPGATPLSVSTEVDKSSEAKLPNVSKKLTVDHVIWLDKQPIANLLVGLESGRTDDMQDRRCLSRK
ncbi:hypothetical protein AYL99_05931 [Fonsecaea erecta]|uniref:Uncharacterized protein n=1 Tax=Fonsecaea erecta TaxID=1367422 RepID=A0A178ZM86_9EURO|nr:hypothetical protein AYL99_05931 [Fonsecaea erecta]OAP60929.1 hypothetical protein AYL99_05931 [Fonsecaea erecta]